MKKIIIIWCDGKCPRMSNYDKRNGILTDKERTDEPK